MKHRNLLGHAPKHLHDELTEDYRDMICAETAAEVETRRKAFLRKWRLKCRAVADSLEEAGERLFAFTRLVPSQWKSARTTSAIERLNEEFRRRIKTQTVLRIPPSARPHSAPAPRNNPSRGGALSGSCPSRAECGSSGRGPSLLPRAAAPPPTGPRSTAPPALHPPRSPPHATTSLGRTAVDRLKRSRSANKLLRTSQLGPPPEPTEARTW